MQIVGRPNGEAEMFRVARASTGGAREFSPGGRLWFSGGGGGCGTRMVIAEAGRGVCVCAKPGETDQQVIVTTSTEPQVTPFDVGTSEE